MPTPSIVARGALGIRKEASFASGGGIDNWQVIESAAFRKTNVFVYQDRVRNSPEQVGGRYAHTVVSADVTFPISPSNPTQWWNCGVGGSGPYTPSLPLSSMAMELQEGDVGAVYSSGDMISRLTIESRQGDILKCTVAMECKEVSGRASTTIPSTAFPSGDDPYLHSEATFTLDGVANNQVVHFTVSKENHLVTDLLANNRTRRDIPASKTVVTGSMALLFETTTQRNRFFNQLPSSLTALYSRGGNSFQIDLVNINWDTDERPMQGQTSYITETMNFTAFVNDPNNQNSLKITVV